jgi:hypothetical protein
MSALGDWAGGALAPQTPNKGLQTGHAANGSSSFSTLPA